MTGPRPLQRVGLLAFAFDADGRRLLDALVERPGLDDRLVICHHGVADAAGEAGAILSWLRRIPRGDWEPPPWSNGSGSLAAGLDAAIRDALDPRRWQQREGGVEQIELAVIAPSSGIEELPDCVASNLQALRRRYQAVRRIVLLVRGTFQTVGHTGVKAKVSPLPFWTDDGGSGGDQGVFDLIVLLDQIDLRNRVFNDEAQTLAHAAATLAQLTLSEAYGPLYERLQAENARLPAGGRYVSFGVAEWPLVPDQVEAAAATSLYRQMAHLVSEQAAEADDAALDGDDDAPERAVSTANSSLPRSDDPWLQDLEEKAKKVTPKTLAHEVERIERIGAENLADVLAAREASLPLLVPLLARGRRTALRLQRERSTELAVFMRRFARWYAGGNEAPQSPTVVGKRKIWNRDRIALFSGLLLTALGSGVAVELTPYQWASAVLAITAGVGALVVALRGLSRTEMIFGKPAARENMMEELGKKRAALAFAAAITVWCERVEHRLQQAIESFRNTPTGAIDWDSAFPLTPEVCSAILERRSLTADRCLADFWREKRTEVVQELTQGGDGLPHLLEDYARHACRGLRDLRWDDVIEALGGDAGLSGGRWNEELEKAREAAVPRMPVPGASSYTLLVLPRSLPWNLKEALEHRFPEHARAVAGDGDSVVVLQVTQGYQQGG